jgi:predicted secreted Zn-dependent protease
VDEVSLSAVIQRLNTQRLEGADAPLSQGLTTYRITPTWQPAASGGVCRVARMTLRVEVTIVLPSWSGAQNVIESERVRWGNIFGAIQAHEHQHRDLTVQAAQELLAALSRLEARGCASLRRAFAGEVARADDRLSEAHEEFDRAAPTRLVGLPLP